VIHGFWKETVMSDLFVLSERQMARIGPHFPLAHGVPRVDDRRVVSGIVYVIKHGLQWKDAPKDYGPQKTLYNRFIRWSRLGVFDRIFAALAGEGPRPEVLSLGVQSRHLMDWIDDETIRLQSPRLQMNSYGVRPLSVFNRRPKL